MTAWDAFEWRRLRAAWAATAAQLDEEAFWRAVAAAMGTNRSPAAVARRAGQVQGLPAKIAAA